MTILDGTKVQEKHVEDWLFDNPEEVKNMLDCNHFEWIGRQIKVPSGIIDLLGYGAKEPCAILYVIEVKKVPATSDALSQVLRYKGDVEEISHLMECQYDYPLFTQAAIIASGPIENNLLHSCNAAGVPVYGFDIELSINLHGAWRFTQDYSEKRKQQLAEVEDYTIFDGFKDYLIDKLQDRHYLMLEFEEAMKNATEAKE